MQEVRLGGFSAAVAGSARRQGVQQVPGVPGWLRLRVGKRPEREGLLRDDQRREAIDGLHRESNIALVGVNVSELYMPGARL
jgi:hypothetical protein